MLQLLRRPLLQLHDDLIKPDRFVHNNNYCDEHTSVVKREYQECPGIETNAAKISIFPPDLQSAENIPIMRKGCTFVIVGR
jgi:hypothetical protein